LGPHCRTLRLLCCRKLMTDKGIKSLTRLAALTTLGLADRDESDEPLHISARGIRTLAKLPALTSLSLGVCC
jgi:hypothetical protein